jgi:tetratricopeptide (TPR) repeat protein
VETSADHVAFRHALTREASSRAARPGAAQAAPARRRGLERLHVGALEDVSDLARHFHEAGGWEKVLHYATQAGERARALYAPHAAAEQFSMALEAAAHLGQADLHLHRSRGLAYETLGEFDRGLADLEAALALARRAGDGRAQWQGLIDLGLHWAARDYARTGACYREAMVLARGTDDRALLAQTLNWLGNWHLNVAQPVDGLRCHREALAIFEELGDRRGVAETLDLLALAANMEDNLVESVTHIRRAIRLFRDLDDRQRLCSSLSLLANSLGDRLFHDVASPRGCRRARPSDAPRRPSNWLARSNGARGRPMR